MAEDGHQFLKTVKGKEKLFYKGYLYNKNRGTFPENIYWRCEDGRKINSVTGKQETTCPIKSRSVLGARILTQFSGSAKTEYIGGETIVHEISLILHGKMSLKQQTRQKVCRGRLAIRTNILFLDLATAKLKPSQIIQAITASTSADVASQLPSKNALRLTVKR